MQEQASTEFTRADERALFDRLYIIAGIGWGIAIFALGFAMGVLR
jgi:hypothetical protein